MQYTSPVLVGRSTETAALRAALARAEQHRGQAVFLVGEPGIGKSRLAAELTGHAARHGFRVIKGRASRAVPLRALCEAVPSSPTSRHYLGALPACSRASRRSHFESTGGAALGGVCGAAVALGAGSVVDSGRSRSTH